MSATKNITIRLDPADCDRLKAEPDRRAALNESAETDAERWRR
jgi:hypothetical protein